MQGGKWALATIALVLGGVAVCRPAWSASDCDPLPVCSGDECGFPLNPGLPGNACGAAGYTAKVSMTFSQEAGGQRTFFVYRPPVPGPLPVVIVYHGGDDHCTAACAMMTNTHMKDVADAQGFIMIFPLGQHPLPAPGGACRGWGWRYSEYQELQPVVSDVQFTRELIAFALASYCIDPARIHATGLSQGGFLSYRLACQLSDWITAVAPVAAGDVFSYDPRKQTFPEACQPLASLYDDCHPFRPVPVLHAHGTGDAAVGYNGGGLCNSWPGAGKSTLAWVGHDGCAPGSTTVVACEHTPCAAHDVSCEAYGSCSEDAEVQLCTVYRGQHVWPGGTGDPSGDLDASEYMAPFFARFSRDPSLVNVTWASWTPGVSPVLNRLAKTTSTSFWDEGAFASERLWPGNGSLQMMASETSTKRFVGLDQAFAGGSFPFGMDYGFELDVNGSLSVVDAGVVYSDSWSYTPGDLLRIDIRDGEASFLRNDKTLRTSALAPQYPLRVFAGLYSPGATLGGVVLSGNVAP